jgi:cell division septal protein FtsQ
MWDKPDVLNAIASSLFAAAFLLAACGTVLYVVQLPLFPLREVRVSGELSHVTLEQVETIVKREVRGNFFTLDLAGARTVFEKLPWVRKVNVRRQWPDRLEVTLEEHVPLARWGNAALVNTQGEVFTAAYDGAPASREQGPAERGAGTRLRDATAEPAASASAIPSPCASPGSDPKGNPLPPCDAPRLRDANGRESGAAPSSAGVASVSGVTSPKGAPVPPSDGALPLFIGPPESAKEIAIQYGYFRRSLASVGQVPVQVQVSPRRAWQIRLESGLTLELGREAINSRLDRFIAVYDRSINRLDRNLDYVDLRYPNGFAVRIPELRAEPQQKRRSGTAARASG